MAGEIRELNIRLDEECLYLAEDMTRLSKLTCEANTLRNRLAYIEAEVANLKTRIPQRERVIDTIMNMLPLTQMTPEPKASQSSGSEGDRSLDQPYLTQIPFSSSSSD